LITVKENPVQLETPIDYGPRNIRLWAALYGRAQASAQVEENAR
jgi:hypothetical protein